MKNLNILKVLALAVLLSACAKSPKQLNFQQQGTQILGKYATGVSRGFTSSSSSSARGAYYDSTASSNYSYWQSMNGNNIMKKDISQDVQDCVAMVENAPKDCANYQFVVSSLSRCLDRIISYRNPMYTNAFQNLDRTGQQYWTYLLDWRRPRPYQQFSSQDYNQIAPYAASGYVEQNLTY